MDIFIPESYGYFYVMKWDADCYGRGPRRAVKGEMGRRDTRNDDDDYGST